MRLTRQFARRVAVVTVCGLLIVAGSFWISGGIYSPFPEVGKPPNEQDRVTHPTGFSIVKPGRTRVLMYSDHLSVVPDGGRSRYTASLMVLRWTEPPDFAKLQRYAQYVPGRFQDREAFISSGPSPSGEYTKWSALFRRGDEWFTVSISLPGGSREGGSMPPPQWLAYLNTFKSVSD